MLIPNHVNELLNHLGDVVLGPWMDHHIETFPNGWIELSDASGSPFFIGPENCKSMSIRSIQHMLQDKPYADRVYDNNYQRLDRAIETMRRHRAKFHFDSTKILLESFMDKSKIISLLLYRGKRSFWSGIKYFFERKRIVLNGITFCAIKNY